MEKKKTNSRSKKTTTKKSPKKDTSKKIVKRDTIKKTTKKKKGFTLIELLAVIIILGILMIIAIPSVTKYISDSRKSSYVDTAKEIVSGTRNLVNEGKLGMYDTSTTYYIPSSYIQTENASKSPYGDFVQAYVGVVYDGAGYKYYWISADDAGQGVKYVTSSETLSIDDIVSDLNPEDIYETVKTTGIEGRPNILILKDDGTWDEIRGAVNNINPDGSVNNAVIPLSNTIYWALQDNDSNGTNETLILSNSVVNGNYYGSFSGDKVYTNYSEVPWIIGYANDANNLSINVTNVKINGVVAPISTSYWFYGVGYNVSKFDIDISNLRTNNTTEMACMFCLSGYNATEWNLKGLKNINTSNVTNMSMTFAYISIYVDKFNLDVSTFDTSNVTNMTAMFSFTGRDASEWSITGFDKWDTSKVTNMGGMFTYAGNKAQTFNLDISHFNTSNVTTITMMFEGAGADAETFNITIPRTNGAGINNTTTKLYGKTTSVSVSARSLGVVKPFTLANQ